MSTNTSTFVRNELAKRFDDIPRFVRGISKLPRDAVIHYLLDDGTTGPKKNSSILKDLINDHDEIYVHHIMELEKEFQLGRRLDTSKMRKAEKEYFDKHRHFSRVHNLERTLMRANAPVIINYNHIFTNYKILKSRPIDKLNYNMGNFANLWHNVANMDIQHLQLIPIRLPRLVKDLHEMKTVIKKPTQTNMLKYTSLNDMYLYSLMQIVYAEEFDAELAKRNVVFRLIDGINFVDIPYRLICNEIEKKGGSSEERLREFYDIINALIELRVGAVDETEGDIEIKASSIAISNEPVEKLNVEENIMARAQELKAQGVLSDGEIKRIEKDMVKYRKIEIDGKKIETILAESKKDKREVPPSTIPEIKAPIGESVKANTVQQMDRAYIENNLEQDLVENLAVLSNAGFMVLDVKREKVRDAATDEIHYSVQTRHINGAVATMKFQIPNVKPDGTFRSGGVNYRMGKQRMTLPIVKISPNEVAMTSSHSKMFARTDRTASDNMSEKVARLLNEYILDDVVTKFKPSNGLKPDNNYGYIEGAIAKNYSYFEYKGLVLDFVKGHTYKKEKVKIDDAGNVRGKELYGNVLTLLDIPLDKVGKPFSELRLKGANIPISVILGSWLGLDEFFKRIGVVATEYEVNQRVDKSKGPILRFKDVKVQIQYRNMEQLLLINGLAKQKDVLKEIERDSLDKANGWRVFFTLMGLGRGQERGIANIRNTWIDSITAKLLVRQKHPTEMLELLLTVNKLLSTTKFSRESDGDLMFIRSYDRINDLVYREMMNAVNEFESSNSPKRKLTMNPKAVKMAILSDGLVAPTEDTSPINQISNQTRLGYGGTGGRSDRSLMSRHRVFDENDLGVISEAGTDDGKAGTILNTPANPNFDSIYGTSSEKKETELGNVLSANTLNIPFGMHDEMKRVIFSRIQSNSMIYSEGYRIMPVYTGMGMVIAHQVDGNYTHVAKDAGTIFNVKDKYIEVKYKDGSKVKLKKGRGFSRNSGKIFPKQLITDYKKGDKFRKGAVLVWDTNYFARCMIEPDQVELYNGAPIFMAIKEESDTYEDGSALDQLDGDTKLASKVIHTRALSIDYKKEFKLLVKEGDYVSPNTPVAVIAPEGVEITDDDQNLDFMSQVSPKAKHSGEIVRIEVNYIGDPKNASPGLRKAIRTSDAQFKEESEYDDVHPNGEIKEPTYISQEYLDKESAVITIYIEHLDKYSVGDKSSDCSALKTVNGYVWSGRIETLSGIRIGGKFAGDGIFRRVVTSAFSVGLLNFCQYTAGVRMSDIYHGRKK